MSRLLRLEQEIGAGLLDALRCMGALELGPSGLSLRVSVPQIVQQLERVDALSLESERLEALFEGSPELGLEVPEVPDLD